MGGEAGLGLRLSPELLPHSTDPGGAAQQVRVSIDYEVGWVTFANARHPGTHLHLHCVLHPEGLSSLGSNGGPSLLLELPREGAATMS